LKYADRIIGLMGAFPGREWRMGEIVRYVEPGSARKDRNRVRQGVLRVLDMLCEAGSVIRRPSVMERGAPVWYAWKSAT